MLLPQVAGRWNRIEARITGGNSAAAGHRLGVDLRAWIASLVAALDGAGKRVGRIEASALSMSGDGWFVLGYAGELEQGDRPDGTTARFALPR